VFQLSLCLVLLAARTAMNFDFSRKTGWITLANRCSWLPFNVYLRLSKQCIICRCMLFLNPCVTLVTLANDHCDLFPQAGVDVLITPSFQSFQSYHFFHSFHAMRSLLNLRDLDSFLGLWPAVWWL